MPALNPPSMQIGALPPGATTLTPQPGGPGIAAQMAAGLWNSEGGNVAQIASANFVSSASGPASATIGLSPTQTLTALLVIAAVSASAGASLGPAPAGFTRIVTQTQATLDFGIYLRLANPGGIGSVQFTALTATGGGFAGQFYEIDNVRCLEAQYLFTSAGSSTSPTTQAGAAVTAAAQPSIARGAIGYVLGSATFSNNGSGTGMNGGFSQLSSTGGVSNNASLLLASNSNNLVTLIGQSWTYKFGGTLSVSSVWASGLVILDGIYSGLYGQSPSHALAIDQGAGYSVGDAGSAGWSLGGTKPGGAGSGQ